MTERAYCRLAYSGGDYGIDARDFAGTEVDPADLGLTEDNFTVEEKIAATGTSSLEHVVHSWKLGPWTGLRVHFDIPPGASGFPEMYGACRWSFWQTTDGWRHSAALEYPTSSVRRAPRWHDWLQGFIADAELAFGGVCQCHQ